MPDPIRRREVRDGLMVALTATPRWTVDAYLELEGFSSVKHEYIQGYVYAMAGGTQAHDAISANIVALLRAVVRGGLCRVDQDTFLYPDVSISCDPADRQEDRAWIAAPRLVVEVLSESRATYDRTDKFTLVARNPALTDYLLTDSRRMAVELRTRQADGTWETHDHGVGETVVLTALPAMLSVDAIYDDVAMPAA